MLTVGILVLLAVSVLLWPPAHPAKASMPTVAGARRRRVGRRNLLRAQADLADALALMSGPLRMGVPPATALRVAIEAVDARGALERPFHELLEATDRGDGIAAVWLTQARALGNADLRFVGQAWRLTERTGAPLAQALESAEEVLRERQRSRERLAAATAGPRASMLLLAMLPLCGPFAGAAFGLSPVELYLSSPVATASLLAGVGLAFLAWRSSRWIIDRAIGAPAPPRGVGALRG